MAEAISIRNLTKSFGPTPVLDGIDLEIAAGELFFLLGPSGCGKTTLLRCVAGLCPPDSGYIFCGGRDITNRPVHRRDMPMVFQNYALWPHMTVFANVAFGLEMRGFRRAAIRRQVEDALRLVRLEEYAQRRPGELSGGQQQRVALARALVVRPGCVLLDEPLSNLDAGLRLEMRAEIRRICREARVTAMYVTHDQKEAMAVADRLAVMKDGQICQTGTPRDMYCRPRSRFVAQCMGESNFIPCMVVACGHGCAQVKTPAGVWPVTAPAEVAAGVQAWISVRPESAHIGAAPPEAVRLKGNIVATVFLGDTVRHEVVPVVDGMPGMVITESHPALSVSAVSSTAQDFWMSPDELVLVAD